MANYNCYYLGSYIKVYPPKREYTDKLHTCSNIKCNIHGKCRSDKFCSVCGSPIEFCSVQRNGHVNMQDFLIEELKDENLFQVIYMDNKDYQIFIPNSKEQGGTYIEEYGEYSLSESANQFEHNDWIALIEKLEEKEFNFEKKIGVVSYYN